MLKRYLSFFRQHMTAQRWAYLLLGVGIILRLLRYFSNPVVFSDDALRVLEVEKYSYFQLFQLGRVYPSIVHDPYGFLIIQKFLISLFGQGAFVFRLVPFVSSLLALVLFCKIKDWFVSDTGGLLALGLFAVCPALINYTAIFNTYPSDICLVLLIYWFFRWMDINSLKWPQVIAFSLLGSLGIWFSLQSVFILSGGMFALLAARIRKTNFRKAFKLFLIYGVWMANFAFYYFYALQFHITKAGSREFWQENLAPATREISFLALWFVKKFYAIFANPASVLPFIGLYLFLIGCFIVWQKRKLQLCILLLPIILTALAAVLNTYAFADRALIFLIPSLYLLIGEGWACLYQREKAARKPFMISAIMLALVFIVPLYKTINIMQLSFQRSGVKEVLDYIDDHYRAGDIICVYYNAHMPFLYYKDATGANRKEYLLASFCRKNIKCHRDMDHVKQYQRVWFLFFKMGDTEEIKLWQASLAQWAQFSGAFRTHWAGVYLYEKNTRDIPLNITQP